MPWQKKDIAPPLIDGMEQVAAGVDTVVSATDAILGTALSVLNVAKNFVAGTVDPTAALANQIIAELDSLITSIFATGAYNLIVTPNNIDLKEIKTFSDVSGIPLMTPSKAINYMRSSFDDVGDINRPRFSDSDVVSGIGFMVTAPDAKGFSDALAAFTGALGLAEFNKFLDDFNLMNGIDDGGDVQLASRKPDWTSKTLASIPILADQESVLRDQLETFKGYQSNADDAIGDLIRIMERKLGILTSQADQLKGVIESIKNATLASGVYVLDIPTASGGNTYLKDSLVDSELRKLNKNGYTIATLFVGGGPTLAAVETLKSLLI